MATSSVLTGAVAWAFFNPLLWLTHREITRSYDYWKSGSILQTVSGMVKENTEKPKFYKVVCIFLLRYGLPATEPGLEALGTPPSNLLPWSVFVRQ